MRKWSFWVPMYSVCPIKWISLRTMGKSYGSYNQVLGKLANMLMKFGCIEVTKSIMSGHIDSQAAHWRVLVIQLPPPHLESVEQCLARTFFGNDNIHSLHIKSYELRWWYRLRITIKVKPNMVSRSKYIPSKPNWNKERNTRNVYLLTMRVRNS